MTNTDLREPSELVEKLQALRRVCDACNQPLYVQILDEVLPEIERLTPTPEPSLREALASVCRKFAAAWCALDFAHSEGFEWPTDPLGEEALAFADPTIVPEYAALSASPAEPEEATEAMLFAMNLKTIAKRERNIGNAELSAVIDEAALMIDRLTAMRSAAPGGDG